MPERNQDPRTVLKQKDRSAYHASVQSQGRMLNVHIIFTGEAHVAWDDLGNKATLWLCSEAERIPITMTAQSLEDLYHVLNHALAVTRPKVAEAVPK